MTAIPLIVINSPSTKAGKTTFAFNLAAALWQDNYKVGIYSDFALQFIESRENITKDTSAELPFPYVITDLENLPSDGAEKEVIIVEIPTEKNSEYSAIMAKAHTLVTVADKQADVSWKLNSPYLNLIWNVKKQAASRGRKYLNWIVLENKTSEDSVAWDKAVADSSRQFGYRLSPIMQYRPSYQHIADGYCTADMIIKNCGFDMTMADMYARHEILRLTDFMWQDK